MVGRGDARWVDGQMAGSMLSRRKVRSSLAVRRYEQGRRIGKADPVPPSSSSSCGARSGGKAARAKLGRRDLFGFERS
jgi:hypothetical protein